MQQIDRSVQAYRQAQAVTVVKGQAIAQTGDPGDQGK
jgi:hypothetical protein